MAIRKPSEQGVAVQAVQAELPYPPSVNTYYRVHQGRVIISREGRAYREAVADLFFYARGGRRARALSGPLEAEVVLRPPDRRRRDLDNPLKCLLDSLQHAGVFGDDSQLVKLTVWRVQPSPPLGGVMVRLRPANLDHPHAGG